MIEPVPLYVGVNEAQHSADVLRLQLYAAFGGQEGVLGRFDLRITEGDTPGSFINVAPGACSILARGPAQQYQMYADLSRTQTQVSVSPTDSSGGRTDLVILRVEDPSDGSGLWSAPESPANGPYISVRVVEGVPAGTKSIHDLNLGSWSALTLARLDIPASTATVTQGMVTDLRIVSNPTTGLGPAPDGPGAEKLWTEESHTTVRNIVKHDQRSYINWPQEANWTVNVPEWATAVDIFAVVMNAQLNAGDVWGDAYLDIGGQGGTPTGFDLNANGAKDPYRAPVFVSGTQAIPASVRGQAASVKIMAKMYNDARVAGYLQADTSTYTHIQLNFKQHPVYV